MFNFIKRYLPHPHEALNSYTYTYGGDMRGGGKSTKVKRISEKEAVVSFTNQESHNSELEVNEYLVSSDILKDIEKIFDKNKLARLEFSPKVKMKVLDKGSGSHHFYFENGKLSRCSTSMRLSKRGIEGLNQIRELINNKVKGVPKLPRLIKRIKEDNHLHTVKEGVIELEVLKYVDDYLYYSINNGLNEEFAIKKAATILKKDGENLQEIFKYEFPYEFKIYKNAITSNDFKVENGRLLTGKYIFKVDEYSTEFEIG